MNHINPKIDKGRPEIFNEILMVRKIENYTESDNPSVLR